MKQSKLFSKTLRNVSDNVKSTGHRLLLQAGFIFPIAAGIYSLSPLGFRVFEKIKNIIREDFNSFEVNEVSMPIVHPAKIWQQTGRFEDVGEELWKIKNREGEDFVLAMTHEETAGFTARNLIQTYRDLPILINQFQIKIRDELRSKGGLLRTKEFLMQDAYSFDRDEKGMDESYKKFYNSYVEIFKKLSLDAVAVEASGGVMGGGRSHEFMLISDVGEDKIAVCEKCDYKANTEILKENDSCLKCGSDLFERKSIELGQTFKLGLKYSEPFNVKFKDGDGKEKPVFMGSYGIGIGRAMTSIVESHNDEKGIIWPENTAPFKVHLISLGKNKEAEKLLGWFKDNGMEDILYDDRDYKTPGEKFNDADLIGIPYRVVISDKTVKEKSMEIKKRNGEKKEMLPMEKLPEFILKNFNNSE